MKQTIFWASIWVLNIFAFSVHGKTLTPSEFNKAGQFAVSGTLNYNVIDQEDTDLRTLRYTIDLNVGYMLIDSLQLKLGYRLEDTETTDGQAIVASSGGGGIKTGLNYYFDVLSRYNLFPHLGASLMFGSRSQYASNMNQDVRLDFDVYQVAVGTGITQALGNAHGGFATLSLDYVRETNEATACASDSCDIESDGLHLGFALGLYF
ncbi:MAG: hypothetical protein ACPGQS_04775 [Bradymonadia bacterium]